MVDQWTGCEVSVDCGPVLGSFQGEVQYVNVAEQTLILFKPINNGVQCPSSTLTLNAADVQNLKIIRTKDEVRADKVKSSLSFISPIVGDTKSTTAVQPQPRAIKKSSPKSVPVVANNGNGVSVFSRSPKKTLTPTRRKNGHGSNRHVFVNEDCFGVEVQGMADDFDFEKNLALFDKAAVFRQIETDNGGPVDRSQKYGCHESIVPIDEVKPDSSHCEVQYRKGNVGDGNSCIIYRTDCGVRVPTVDREIRDKLFQLSASLGISFIRQLEAVGLATSDLVMNLLGGGHRFSPENLHQYPTVALLCGSHMRGAQAINAARQLANRGVKSLVFVPAINHKCQEFKQELEIVGLTPAKVTSNLAELASADVDLIVDALSDGRLSSQNLYQAWCSALYSWANCSRAPVLAFDPSSSSHLIQPTWCLQVCLPPPCDFEAKMYLAQSAVPHTVFAQMGIKYTSPFGHKCCIPLRKSTPSAP